MNSGLPSQITDDDDDDGDDDSDTQKLIWKLSIETNHKVFEIYLKKIAEKCWKLSDTTKNTSSLVW